MKLPEGSEHLECLSFRNGVVQVVANATFGNPLHGDVGCRSHRCTVPLANTHVAASSPLTVTSTLKNWPGSNAIGDPSDFGEIDGNGVVRFTDDLRVTWTVRAILGACRSRSDTTSPGVDRGRTIDRRGRLSANEAVAKHPRVAAGLFDDGAEPAWKRDASASAVKRRSRGSPRSLRCSSTHSRMARQETSKCQV